jgi:hypothetical protein
MNKQKNQWEEQPLSQGELQEIEEQALEMVTGGIVPPRVPRLLVQISISMGRCKGLERLTNLGRLFSTRMIYQFLAIHLR